MNNKEFKYVIIAILFALFIGLTIGWYATMNSLQLNSVYNDGTGVELISFGEHWIIEK